LCFSVDESQLVSCSDDGTVLVWNALTGERILEHGFVSRSVSSVALSHSGLIAVALSDSGQIRLERPGNTADAVLSVAIDAPSNVRFAQAAQGARQNIFVSSLNGDLFVIS